MAFRVEGTDVFDDTNLVARIQGDRIVDDANQFLAEISGDDLRGSDSQVLGRVHEDEIIDHDGAQMGTIAAAQTQFPGAEPKVAAVLSLIADKL